MTFKGKKVWITGASSGIGEALSLAFAREGAHLILSARNTAQLESVKEACIGAASVRIVPLDIEQHAQVFETAEALQKEIGAIDVLVNNAGISQRDVAMNTHFDVEKRLVDIDLLGTMAVSKAVLPRMVAQKSGQIIVISSVMGKLGAPKRSAYAAAKHGLHGYFDTLRAELYDDNIKVLLVCPGYVRTNISVNAFTGSGAQQGTMDEATDKGFTPSVVAEKIVRAAQNGREEVYIAGGRELLAIYLKRYWPSLLSRIIRKAKTT